MAGSNCLNTTYEIVPWAARYPRCRAFARNRIAAQCFENTSQEPPGRRHGASARSRTLNDGLRRPAPESVGTEAICWSPRRESNTEHRHRKPRPGATGTRRWAPSERFELPTLLVETACTSTVLRRRREPVRNRIGLTWVAIRLRHQTVRAQDATFAGCDKPEERGACHRTCSTNVAERPVRIELTRPSLATRCLTTRLRSHYRAGGED